MSLQVNKLKDQLEDIKEAPGCHQEVSENDSSEKENVCLSENENDNTDKNEKERRKNKSAERGSSSIFSDGSSDQTTAEFSVYSSGWCHEGDNQMCQFENICYNSQTEEFVLFQHKSSILENVKMVDGSITLDLSSLGDHNALQTTVVSLPSETFSKFQVTWVNETTLVFKPFLTDNLMHVLHDDIIPLHHTLKLITMGDKVQSKDQAYSVQLFIFDNDSVIDEDVKKFYEVFSKFKMKSKEDFQTEKNLICFNSVFIGLSKTTVWYDYGFSRPQGPLLDNKADGRQVKSTAQFIRQQLPIPSENFRAQEYLVLFTRKENRKIVNEYELILQVMKTVGMKVVNLNYESYTLFELIMYVSNSKGIIAMHGSLLILSMFLKPGSVVIELFPYAVNPKNYTPYRTLSHLKGMGLIYKAWANEFKENSVGYPDRPPDYGGLKHLENNEREVILHQSEIPPHTCCKDPSWLYHIYQDTIVNTSEISALLTEALSERPTEIEKLDSGLIFYPSKVQNVLCNVSQNSGKQSKAESKKMFLKLEWAVPWTVSYIRFEGLHYEVLVQEVNTDRVESFHTQINKLVVDVKFQGDCYVWVRGVINETLAGPYSESTLCQTDLI